MYYLPSNPADTGRVRSYEYEWDSAVGALMAELFFTGVAYSSRNTLRKGIGGYTRRKRLFS